MKKIFLTLILIVTSSVVFAAGQLIFPTSISCDNANDQVTCNVPSGWRYDLAWLGKNTMPYIGAYTVNSRKVIIDSSGFVGAVALFYKGVSGEAIDHELLVTTPTHIADPYLTKQFNPNYSGDPLHDAWITCYGDPNSTCRMMTWSQ